MKYTVEHPYIHIDRQMMSSVSLAKVSFLRSKVHCLPMSQSVSLSVNARCMPVGFVLPALYDVLLVLLVAADE